MKPFHWGILAPGTIAHKFVQGLSVLKGAVPYAVGSRDLGRAKAFAAQYGIKKAHGSYEELARDPEVDAIYVATPHPFHEPAVLTCLEAGKHVLCEKPFAVNQVQAGRMIDQAREKQLFLMEAMWTRFLPAMRKAAELIEGGAIGQVRHITANFGFFAEVDPESRLFAPDLSGGSLLDVGIYPLALCSMVYNRPPDRIQSRLVLGETGVDEAAYVQMDYEGGGSAQVFSAIRFDSTGEAVIYGTEGHLRIPEFWHASRVFLTNGEGSREFHLPFEASGFQFEILEVMDCIAKGRTESPLMPLDETLALARTMDSIRQANHLKYPFE
jgi:predicted dehydrogenase